MFTSRRSNEFSLTQKTTIFYKQCQKNIGHLHNINIPYISQHLQHVYNTPNFNNMPLCPYCLECFLFPGEMVANELTKKGHIIETPPDLFGVLHVRPAECDHIRSFLHGGRNTEDNGIFVCSDCNKNKAHMDANQFLQTAFIYDANFKKYIKNLKREYIEYMDGDFYNKCYHCDKPSKYQICQNCAGRKNLFITLAYN